MIEDTFTCYHCGIVSSPAKRINFVTEVECMDCYRKRAGDYTADYIESIAERNAALARQLVEMAPAVIEICDKHLVKAEKPWWRFW